MKRVLVTGATGHIGYEVVSQLRGTGCRIRAMSRNPRSANLPADVEVVRGDLSAPDTLDACLNGIDSVFLVWMAPLAAAAPADRRARPASCPVVSRTGRRPVATCQLDALTGAVSFVCPGRFSNKPNRCVVALAVTGAAFDECGASICPAAVQAVSKMSPRPWRIRVAYGEQERTTELVVTAVESNPWTKSRAPSAI